MTLKIATLVLYTIYDEDTCEPDSALREEIRWNGIKLENVDVEDATIENIKFICPEWLEGDCFPHTNKTKYQEGDAEEKSVRQLLNYEEK